MHRFGRRLVSISVNVYERVFTWMENKWALNHPPTYRVYRLFKGGLQLSFGDFRLFVSARSRLLGGDHLHTLSVAELDALRRVPRDLLKLSPVIVIAVLPGSFIFLPIFYMFPRRLLTSRFWSDDQRRTFESEDLKKRALAFPRVNRRLLRALPLMDDASFREMVEELTKGRAVQSTTVVAVSPFFRQRPLRYSTLPIMHLEALCKCHDCRQSRFFRRSRLDTHTRVLFHQDRALLREGIASIPRYLKEELCLSRGCQPFELTEAQMNEFLDRWCAVSSRLSVDEDMSLLLHLPPLLAQNWSPTDDSTSDVSGQHPPAPDGKKPEAGG